MREINKRLNVDIPEDVHFRLKAKCALEGVSVSDLIREIIGLHLNSHKRAAMFTTPKRQPSGDVLARLDEMRQLSKKLSKDLDV